MSAQFQSALLELFCGWKKKHKSKRHSKALVLFTGPLQRVSNDPGWQPLPCSPRTTRAAFRSGSQRAENRLGLWLGRWAGGVKSKSPRGRAQVQALRAWPGELAGYVPCAQVPPCAEVLGVRNTYYFVCSSGSRAPWVSVGMTSSQASRLPMPRRRVPLLVLVRPAPKAHHQLRGRGRSLRPILTLHCSVFTLLCQSAGSALLCSALPCPALHFSCAFQGCPARALPSPRLHHLVCRKECPRRPSHSSRCFCALRLRLRLAIAAPP